MNTGLNPKTIQSLESIFKQFDTIDKVVLYGSRALGTHKPGSDIDLALFGKNVTPDLIASIAILIDDLLLPYTLDLTAYDLIDNLALREHIDRVGIELFQ
ncbi:MAG: nucleotidyltransferase domain-containing protein [Alcaligenaceae bacterium]